MFAILATTLLSPFFLEFSPEVRTAYQSLGKILEDRPMQVTSVREGVDTAKLWDDLDFGRLGIRNWDVSSLTDRRHDVHRHACYHTEFGPTWEYDLCFTDKWRLHSDLTSSWTIYDGFDNPASNKSYWWWQLDQSLENPYLVPFYRVRRYVKGNDYFYFKAGVRHRFGFLENFYITPSIYVEGGNEGDLERVFGKNISGSDWGGGGVGSMNFRLEAGWKVYEGASLYASVDQYEVVGGDVRRTNAASSYRSAHNDLTIFGVGMRFKW